MNESARTLNREPSGVESESTDGRYDISRGLSLLAGPEAAAAAFEYMLLLSALASTTRPRR